MFGLGRTKPLHEQIGQLRQQNAALLAVTKQLEIFLGFMREELAACREEWRMSQLSAPLPPPNQPTGLRFVEPEPEANERDDNGAAAWPTRFNEIFGDGLDAQEMARRKYADRNEGGK